MTTMEAGYAKASNEPSRPPEAAQALSMAHASAEVLQSAYTSVEKAVFALTDKLEQAGILAPAPGSLNGEDRASEKPGSEFSTAHAQQIERLHLGMQSAISNLHRIENQVAAVARRIEI